MRVGQRMTKEPLTIGPKESIVVARTIMRQRGIRRLPVVEGDHLVGIVTDRDLREAWPSDATTLTVHELQYALDRVPVRDIMAFPNPASGPVEILYRVTAERPIELAVYDVSGRRIRALE